MPNLSDRNATTCSDHSPSLLPLPLLGALCVNWSPAIAEAMIINEQNSAEKLVTKNLNEEKSYTLHIKCIYDYI